ncbi:MAG: dNTP triphosphohydrolase, partial [Rhodospirillaceae bacterium]|nr:dNTP triphosphohydrolase [Rhodospirillales bacterium]
MTSLAWEERRSGWTPQTEDARSPFDVDYARIIHSASFRRLQGKTQILNLGDSDFYRTRLTHSLEVAQIAAGIVRQFQTHCCGHESWPHLPDNNLIQVIGLAHDLGHPPFGHGGEVALNYCMRDHGGFEGNGQTLRILSRLEKMSASQGSDLTRRAMLGIIKYPVPYGKAVNPGLIPCLDHGPTAISIIDRRKSKPPKCFLDSEQDVFDWIAGHLDERDRKEFQTLTSEGHSHAKSVHKSFDCSIMDIADDIAYG